MDMKLSKRRRLQLDAFGGILTVMAMLADRFLFTLQGGILPISATMSAMAFAIVVRVVKRADDETEAMQQCVQLVS